MTAVFPTEVLECHTAFVGKTGAGKTSTAKLLVEQVVEMGHRVCILDPIKSDWWGLISSADGKRPGLPFQILGGPRGHVPLHHQAGAAIAELVAAGTLPLSIIDMADFPAGGLQSFFNDFAPVLLRRQKGVLYLVIEEAHLFAPKERSGIGAENMAIHFAKQLATAGRSKGIRLVVATQRTQALHNAVLGSCDTLIAHRLTSPADQAPVIAWLKANLDKPAQQAVIGSLSTLRKGQGWIVSGELPPPVAAQQFPRIATFDNTATPTTADQEHHVTTARIDVDALRAVIGQAATQAEANDPKKLRLRIAELEKQLRQAPASAPAPEFDLPDIHARAYGEGHVDGHAEGRRVGRALALPEGFALGLAAAREALAQIKAPEVELPANHQAGVAQRPEQRVSNPRVAGSSPAARSTAPAPRAAASMLPADGITGPQQRILNALGWLESIGLQQADKTQLAFLADASPSSSSYGNNLGSLRTAGLIHYPSGGKAALTNSGRKISRVDGPASTADLHASIRAKVSGPQWAILEALISAYPEPLDREVVADLTSASAKSSSFGNNLGFLRTMGLIDYPSRGQCQALPILFLDDRQ